MAGIKNETSIAVAGESNDEHDWPRTISNSLTGGDANSQYTPQLANREPRSSFRPPKKPVNQRTWRSWQRNKVRRKKKK